MRVGVLGPLVVNVGEGDISVPGQRQRDLLAALLVRRGTPVPPEVLLSLVWLGDDRLTVTVVHTAVARLRRVWGAAAVERREAGYLVVRSTGTDAEDFTDVVQAARRASRRGDPVAGAELYRRALAIWRGPQPFVGVSAHLVDPDRTRLAELRIAARLELAELLLDRPEAGDPDEAGGLAAAVVVEEPLRERGHELAMLAATAGATRLRPWRSIASCNGRCARNWAWNLERRSAGCTRRSCARTRTCPGSKR